MKIFLINWTVYRPDLVATQVLRFTDGEGYKVASAPGFYWPRVKQALSYVKAITIDPAQPGPTLSGGGIVFKNTDFQFTTPTSLLAATWGAQSIHALGIAGQPVEILIVDDTAAYSTAQRVLLGVGDAIAIDKKTGDLTLSIKDPLQKLKQPLAAYVFAGTNALPAGTEGTANDLLGQHKPVSAGKVWNVPGLQVNTSRDVYQVSDGLGNDIPAVYDKGVSLTKGSSRTFANIDNGSAPTAGQYDYHLGGTGSPPSGMFYRLGTTSQGPMTADVEGPPHTNLGLRSETFDNATWVKTNCTVTANAANDSTGAATADKIVEDSTATVEHYAYQAIAVTANSVYAASVEIQAAGRTFARVTLMNAAETSGIRVDVDLTAGTISRSTFGTASSANSGIASLGGGIYRVAVVGIVDAAATTARVRIQPATALGTVTYTGAGSAGIYASRFQFEATAPTKYQTTVAAAVTSCKAAAADIARDWVVDRAAKTVDLGDIMALNATAGYDSGFFNRDDVSYQTALNAVFTGALAKWYLDSDGTFRFFKLQDPANLTPVMTFKKFKPGIAAATGEYDLIDWAFEPEGGIGGMVPIWKCTVGYQFLWTVQTDGLDAAIAAARKAIIQNEIRWTDPTSTASIQTTYPDAPELRLMTMLCAKADAEALRDAIFSLLNTPRPTIHFTSYLDQTQAAALRLGASVGMVIPDLGWTSTRKQILKAMIYNAKTRIFEGWAWG